MTSKIYSFSSITFDSFQTNMSKVFDWRFHLGLPQCNDLTTKPNAILSFLIHSQILYHVHSQIYNKTFTQNNKYSILYRVLSLILKLNSFYKIVKLSHIFFSHSNEKDKLTLKFNFQSANSFKRPYIYWKCISLTNVKLLS